MRFLAIDFGVRKVGLALSDQGEEFAFPYAVVKREEALSTIVSLVKEKGIEAVVFGSSKDLKGNDNPVQVQINTFAETIKEKCGLPIFFEPEFYSSREAARLSRDHAMIDASAAAVILKGFLERRNNQKTA